MQVILTCSLEKWSPDGTVIVQLYAELFQSKPMEISRLRDQLHNTFLQLSILVCPVPYSHIAAAGNCFFSSSYVFLKESLGMVLWLGGIRAPVPPAVLLCKNCPEAVFPLS